MMVERTLGVVDVSWRRLPGAPHPNLPPAGGRDFSWLNGQGAEVYEVSIPDSSRRLPTFLRKSSAEHWRYRAPVSLDMSPFA